MWPQKLFRVRIWQYRCWTWLLYHWNHKLIQCSLSINGSHNPLNPGSLIFFTWAQYVPSYFQTLYAPVLISVYYFHLMQWKYQWFFSNSKNDETEKNRRLCPKFLSPTFCVFCNNSMRRRRFEELRKNIKEKKKPVH